MKYLSELIKNNNHKLIPYNKAELGHKYISVFDYSQKYGGTYDGFRYYNNYVVDITE